ncbi:MAG: S24 family peptidase [Candidatus Nanopelagicales bacterium]
MRARLDAELVITALLLWLLVLPIGWGGMTSWVTTFGISMKPTFVAGDLIAVRRSSDFQVGDIAAYRSDQLRVIALHRIVAITDGKATFQGDNNDWVDPETPALTKLVGKYWFAIPGGGIWLRRLLAPPFLAGYTFLLLLVLMTAPPQQGRRNRRGSREMAGQSPQSASPDWLATLDPGTRGLLYGSVSSALVGLLLLALSFSRPSMVEASTQETQAKGKTVFTYTAQVPKSPAYQGTTVTSPSPIFRSAADEVQIKYQYEGKRGEVAVTAELAAANGWRWSVPLQEPKVVETGYAGTVTLDLADLYTLAQRGAEAIGLPTSEVAVSVIPAVTSREGVFAPALEFKLDAAALRLVGVEGAQDSTQPAEPKDKGTVVSGTKITVTDSTSTSVTTMIANHVNLMVAKLSVATARWLGLLALLLGLVGAAAATFLARRRPPLSAPEAIARQYGELIVPVTSLPPAAGRVIDVADIQTLVKLAERYSLLVMHLGEDHQSTYFVQDESTAYRLVTAEESEG